MVDPHEGAACVTTSTEALYQINTTRARPPWPYILLGAYYSTAGMPGQPCIGKGAPAWLLHDVSLMVPPYGQSMHDQSVYSSSAHSPASAADPMMAMVTLVATRPSDRATLWPASLMFISHIVIGPYCFEEEGENTYLSVQFSSGHVQATTRTGPMHESNTATHVL